MFTFGTKGETLLRLAGRLRLARTCEQSMFLVGEWQSSPDEILTRLLDHFTGPLIVRSSARGEDLHDWSNAGRFRSVSHVAPTRAALREAIGAVVAAYDGGPDDQVLVQPLVLDVALAGVVTTREVATGAPYYVVNYEDLSGRTDHVTRGLAAKCIQVRRSAVSSIRSGRMRRLIAAVGELEAVTGSEYLDIEFCVDRRDEIYILQVRPLAARRTWSGPTGAKIDAALAAVRDQVRAAAEPSPGVVGSGTVLAQMSDWNPAEMIGAVPRPLALSLYRRLITDEVWAQARRDMGYAAPGRPLMLALSGRPFIDVRLSLNSFLPCGLDEGVRAWLVDHQLARLAANRDLHDKIEFEIAVTCFDPAFDQRTATLVADGLPRPWLAQWAERLREVTAGALARRSDLAGRVAALEAAATAAARLAALEPLARFHTLVERCRREGTLPFAGLARHAFIAVAFVRALVARGALSAADAEALLGNVATVPTHMHRDMHALASGRMTRAAFLARYGHLRPGTYDITSHRYDETPDAYLSHLTVTPPVPRQPFVQAAPQRAAIDAVLAEARLGVTAADLLHYVTQAVAAREWAKFWFTRMVSDALAALAEWGERAGLSRDDLAMLALEDLEAADGATPDPAVLAGRIAEARERHRVAEKLCLPSVIAEPADVDVVRLPLESPTFVTRRSVTARTAFVRADATPDVAGRIVLIESADPGYDWLLSHGAAGLITMFGGANSHMAIRATECGIPAAIGCGRRRFEALAQARTVLLDCSAGLIQRLD